MNPNDGERYDDDFAERLAEFDEQLSGEEYGSALPNRENLKSDDRLQGAAECLRMMELIRREIPEELDHALTDTNNESLPTPVEGAVSFDELQERPTQIGRFRILSELGSGGYGVVFKALDPKLNRTVALKIPRPEVLVTNDLRQRFLLEAKAAATLHHPNVVSVFESGNAGPICYIASAYCDGESLAERLKRTDDPVTIKEAVRLVYELAGAVQHAHDRGILHRDLKPSNVLLDRSPDNNSIVVPRITDFGLARIANDESIETKTGEILGTPSYMAPEQAESRHSDVGTAADIYALGAILYELLTEQPPFKKDSLLATLEAVRSDEPVSPRRLRNELPRDLEAICLKCLEKKPEIRYRSSADLAEDLNRFENREPVKARALTPPKRLVRWCRRKKLQATAIAIVVLSLVSVLFVTGFAAVKVSRLNDELTASNIDLQNSFEELETTNKELSQTHLEESLQRKRAERNFAKAREAVNEILMPDKNFGTVPHMTYQQQFYLERAMEFYTGFLEHEPENIQLQLDVARTCCYLGIIQLRLERRREAKNSIEKSLSFLSSISEDDQKKEFQVTQANCYNILSSIHLKNNSPIEAKLTHDRAWNAWSRLVNKYPDDLQIKKGYAHSAVVRCAVLAKLRQPRKEIEFCEKVLQTFKQWNSESQPELLDFHADLLLAMANAFQTVGDRKSAIIHIRTACAHFEHLVNLFPIFSPHQRKLGTALYTLGVITRRMRQLPESKIAFKRSTEIAERQVNHFPGLPDLANELGRRYRGYAQLLLLLKEFEQAQAILIKAIEVTDSLLEQEPNSTEYLYGSASTHLGISDVYRLTKKFDKTIVHIEKANAIFEQLVNQWPNISKYSYQLGSGYQTLAEIAVTNRKYEDAGLLFRKALPHLKKAFAKKPRFQQFRIPLKNGYKSLATVLVRLGKPVEAIETLEELVKLKPSHHTFYIGAAHTAVKCAGIIQKNKKRTGVDKRQWVESLSAKAVEFLKTAVENGLPNAQHIERDPLFKPLHSRKDFQKLVKDTRKVSIR